MEHDGRALAADETDHTHHRPPGIASVHTRAAITWISIFPLATLGMYLIAAYLGGWPIVLRALLLTLVVVPTSVYVIVPRLLLLHSRFRARINRRRAAAGFNRTPARSQPNRNE